MAVFGVFRIWPCPDRSESLIYIGENPLIVWGPVMTEYALISISWNLESKELEASSPDDKFRSDLDLFGWQVVIAKSI